MLTKDQEFAFISIKPETITKFKVGAKKDGRIVALVHEIHISVGAQNAAGHSSMSFRRTNKNSTPPRCRTGNPYGTAIRPMP